MAVYDSRTIARLWSMIEVGEPAECWPWVGASTPQGYGRFKIDGKLKLPHRVVYECTKGPIPKGTGYHGTVIRHRCDNPACCNPAHLEPGTHRDNVMDMHRRGRASIQNGAVAKRLPADVIRAARSATGTMREIGARLGISNSTVSRIKRGLCGQHVP